MIGIGNKGDRAMAKFINHELKRRKNITIYNTSDWHVGSLAFHKEAADHLIDKVASENAFLTFGGDAIEGKLINSPHFNPQGLKSKQLDIHNQAKAFCDMLRPVAKRVLMIQTGNHELYLLPNLDIVEYMCENLNRPDIQGDYQTWLNVNGCTMHFWHGRQTMPRGAKDPIQREANQKAWLKNNMFGLAGSAQAQFMAHTHHCMIVPPIEQYALLNNGENVHGQYFVEEIREINGDVWVPPDARWYVNTGTLRRGGGFSHQDYSEIAGYTPPPIACTKTSIESGRIVNIEKVML
jgi:hypothetical protein